MNPAAVFVLSFLLAGTAAASQDAATTPILKAGPGVPMPVVVTEVKPAYPVDALANGIEGVVKMEAVVEPDGSVGDVRVLQSLYPSLDEAAVEAMKRWRFKPIVKEGQLVRVAVDVEMAFTYRPRGPRLDSNGVFKAGAPGLRMPAVLKEVKPVYTAAAREAGIQGMVTLECVVLPEGTIGHTRVTQRLDAGLDVEAMKALKQWRFSPGTHGNQPVPVQVSVEMSFTLK